MMPPDLVERIHASPLVGVVAVTGGGSGAIERLLTTPGASATVLEAVVPYCTASLAEWLGGEPGRACDGATARQMAMRAFERARALAPERGPRTLFGLACTASLATGRTKRGEHRAHVAVQTATRTLVATLRFEKGRRHRSEEEAATAHAVVAALADAAGVHTLDLARTPPGIDAAVEDVVAPPEWAGLLVGERDLVPVNGAAEGGPVCLFPGSFNPPHAGHTEIAQLAAEKTGRDVVFELSTTNVDKPSLDFVEIAARVALLDGRPLWLTRAATFLEKARLAPGAVFAVGVDTIERVGRPRYYADGAARDATFDELAALGCRFLVFGRLTGERFEGLEELSLPPKLRALCEGVSEAAFRVDVSSTALREDTRP